jgi:hypothetical protein
VEHLYSQGVFAIHNGFTDPPSAPGQYTAHFLQPPQTLPQRNRAHNPPAIFTAEFIALDHFRKAP